MILQFNHTHDDDDDDPICILHVFTQTDTPLKSLFFRYHDGHSVLSEPIKTCIHRCRKDFPGVPKKNFFQGGATVVIFHLTNSKLKENNFFST